MKRSPLVRKSHLRRSPFASKKPGRRIPNIIREMVWKRSGGRCEAKHPGCTKRAVHMHHIRMKSQGGKDDVQNLLHVCAAGHHYIHHNTEWAYQRGYLKRTSLT